MSTEFSLAHLTILDEPPPAAIEVASRAGYRYAGLRLLPAAPGGIAYPLMEDAALLRETLARMRATGVGVFDLEIVRLGPATDPRAFLPFFEAGAQLSARAVLVAGDDPDAARLAGIDVTRVVGGVYTLAGLICAVAGWALIGRIGAISAISGGTANLDSITAVVIGGTSLFGGRGSIIGTLIGALIVGVFRNGLALAGANALWQEFAIGLLIIVAVAIDQWIRKVAA